MKRLICSVRCDNCTIISGTVSGIGRGTSPGSTPGDGEDAAAGGAAIVGIAGFAALVALGGLCALGGFGDAVAPAVVVTGATGSFEYSGNVKSKWFSGELDLNFSLAAISAGNASLPIFASRKRPFWTGTSGIDAPLLVITRPDIVRTWSRASGLVKSS